MIISNSIEHEKTGHDIGSPYLVSISVLPTSDQPDWCIYMHTHGSLLEISYVLSGRGSMYCAGKYYELTPGNIVIKNPGLLHAVNSDPNDPMEQVSLLVSGLSISGVAQNHLPIGGLSPIINACMHRELLDAITRDMMSSATRKPFDIEFNNILLATLVQIILNETQDVSRINEPEEEKALIETILRWIDQHYMDSISLDIIADHFHLSIYYLERQFKKYTGMTVRQYLISCRLGEAQRRLIFTEESIQTISSGCGFSNLSYFFTSFKKKVGYTPAEYKNNMLIQSDDENRRRDRGKENNGLRVYFRRD